MIWLITRNVLKTRRVCISKKISYQNLWINAGLYSHQVPLPKGGNGSSEKVDPLEELCLFIRNIVFFSEQTQLSEQSLLFQNNMSFSQRWCPSIFHSHQLNPTIPHMNGEWLFFVKLYGQVCDLQAKTDCIWISGFPFELSIVNMHRKYSVNW